MSAAPDLITFGLYAALGAVAGILAGMLGIGGGLIIVPVLLFIFHLQSVPHEVAMHLAVASSLASIVFTSASSTLSHHCRGAVLWVLVAPMAPGVLVGAAAGAWVADQLAGNTLRLMFGVFECLVAAHLAWGRNPAARGRQPGRFGLGCAGAAIGALSSLFGIGGGTMTVPFLLWCGVNIRNAVATSSACGIPLAISGAAALMAAGWDRPGLPPGAAGYVYWPAALVIAAISVFAAPLGARIAHALPTAILQRAFAGVLFLVGLRLLYPG